LSLDLPTPSDIASAGGVTVVVCEAADVVYVLQDEGIRLLVGSLEGFDSPGTVDLPDPSAVAIGPDGTIYLAGRDSGRILSISLEGEDADGQALVLATMEEGVAPSSLAVADSGALFVGSEASDTVHRVNPGGTVNAIQTDQSVSPLAIAAFQDGLLLNDTIDAGVRFLNIGAATVRDVPGLGGLTVTDLLVDQQRLYTLDPVARNLVVADLQPDAAGVPSAVGAVTTLALDLQGDPSGLAVLGPGMVAVGERESGRILSVDLATGDIQVMAGRSRATSPIGHSPARRGPTGGNGSVVPLCESCEVAVGVAVGPGTEEFATSRGRVGAGPGRPLRCNHRLTSPLCFRQTARMSPGPG
jgi:hypothetical protein